MTFPPKLSPGRAISHCYSWSMVALLALVAACTAGELTEVPSGPASPSGATTTSEASPTTETRKWGRGRTRRVLDTTETLPRDTTIAVPLTPQPVRLTLTPATVSLLGGGSQQFTAKGVLGDGSLVDLPARYTATGGSIGSTGAYVAGQTAGTYRVVASDTTGTLADTAVVTITSTSATGCSAYPYSRRVSVVSTSQLTAALADARPGDLILLADGTYVGYFRVTASGTASQRITLCGSRAAVIDGGGIGLGGYALQLRANYWTVDGFTVRNRLQGVEVQGGRYNTVRNLEIHTMGQEGIHLWSFAKHNLVEGNHIHDMGERTAEYGEGVYIGSAQSKWPTYFGGKPDQTDSNTVRGNLIGPNVTSEHIDAKPGTAWNRIEGNTFDGRGQVPCCSAKGAIWVDSWVEINGNDYYVADNRGSRPLKYGFQTYQITLDGVSWGNRTRYERNHADMTSAQLSGAIGIVLSWYPTGVQVKCDNTALSAPLSNVSCK